MKKTILKQISIFILLLLSFNGLAQDFEVSPVIMNFNAEPGQTQTQAINIFNHANKNSSFSISISDFVVNKEGKRVQMPAASTENSLANWISINPPFVEMAPNEQRQIIVSIQAPVGDYSTKWASILVRSTAEQTALLADKAVQTGLVISGQIEISVFQSPKSNTNFRMKITNLAEITTSTDTVRRFKALADNLGDKITKCKVTLLASNLSTAEEVKLQVLKFEAFPDSQRELELKIPKDALPPGKYALAAILDYGKQSNLEGTQMLITVD